MTTQITGPVRAPLPLSHPQTGLRSNVLNKIYFSGAGQDVVAFQQAPRKTLIVINPTAAGGSVKGTELFSQIYDALRANHPEALRNAVFYNVKEPEGDFLKGHRELFNGVPGKCTYDPTQEAERPPESVEQFVKDHHEFLDRIIAVGGDGTVTHAINSVLDYDHIKVGILPFGTGNRLARELGIPQDLDKALEIALKGQPAPLDVGEFNGQRFTLAAGVGLDAEIMAHVDPEAKKKMGKLAYVWSLKDQIFKARPVTFDIEVDGQKITRTGIGVLVTNAGRLAGPFSLTPKAKPNDGFLDVAIIGPNKLKGLFQMLTFQAGDASQKSGLINLRGKHIRITPHSPVKAQVDGDVVEAKFPVEIRMLPKPVMVMVPPKAGKP